MHLIRIALISIALLLILAPAGFALSILDQDPHIGMFQNLTTVPMRITFNDSIDQSTVTNATVMVSYENAPTRHVDVTFSFDSVNATDDTLVLTPAQNGSKWPFARRLELTITGGLLSTSASAFDGVYPFGRIFVANIPEDMDILQNWDPGDPLDFVDAFANANVLVGYNPVDPENTNVNRPETIPGMGATEAWKLTAGRPDVIIAVVDNGIERYDYEEIAENYYLNKAELPVPTIDGDPCAPDIWDCNADGRFNIRDYDQDPTFGGLGRLPSIQDLIDIFSDGIDDDQNGLPDDICGWDFLRQTNVALGVREFPEGGHGEDRAKDAAAIADNGQGDKPGFCPHCTVLPIRVSDSVMSEINILAEGVQYGFDMGAVVAVLASASLDYNGEVNRLFTELSENGMTLVGVPSDELGYHHSFTGSCDDVISVKSIFPIPPIRFLGFFPMEVFGFTETYCTMWGEGVHLAGSSGACSSEASGNVGGLAGLIISRAWDLGLDLSANEVKQLLTMTADDIYHFCVTLTGGGCQRGWDAHYGYGRPNAARALDALGDPPNGIPSRIPPEVKFREPAWFSIIDPKETPTIDVGAYIFSRGREFDWELQVAAGKEPLDNEFITVASGTSTSAIDDIIADVDVTSLLDPEIYENPPETSFDFTVTLRLQAGYSLFGYGTIMGEDRRTIAIHRDQDRAFGLMPGFPKNLDASGEASVTLYDLDGDNDGRLEAIAGTASGQVLVYKYSEYSDFYQMAPGFPVEFAQYNGLDNPLDITSSTPAVGDLFGNGTPYIVIGTGAGAILVLHTDGNLHENDKGDPSPILAGFPVHADEPDNTSTETFGHGRSFGGSPVLADLDRDGILEIIAANFDGNVYAWKPVDNDGDGQADPVTGFPVFLKSEAGSVANDKVCNREDEQFPPQILGTPVVGVFDPDHGDADIADYPSIFVGTSEVCEDTLLKTTRFYGVYHDGYNNDSGSAFLPGFPVKLAGPISDALAVPPITIGITSTPAMARYDGKTYIGIGSVVWLPQLIIWDGETIKVRNLPSNLSMTLAGHGSFGRLGDDEKMYYVLPTTSAVDMIDGWISLMRPMLVAWDLDDLSKPVVAENLEDSNWYVNTAIADLDNDGKAEMIAGTGGFKLHAINLDGEQPKAWPKFTNNWSVSAPTVGDADADGRLEVFLHTREGNLFAWNTLGDACNDHAFAPEWWNFHHDEHNTGVWGTDTIPPSVATDIQISLVDDGWAISFTSPGDDWQCGTPAAYDIRYARTENGLDTNEEFHAAEPLPGNPPSPVSGGDRVNLTVDFFIDSLAIAIQTVDEAGNLSLISAPVRDFVIIDDDDDTPVDEGDDDDDDDEQCCG